MSTAKDILIKLIDSKSANLVCKRFHYSGKVVPNSQIHFGVFLNDKIEGVLQFGPSTDKRRMGSSLGLGMNEFLELNRMAFSDILPKNSESRAIGFCLRKLKKSYPFLRAIVSFSDACQCGDGAIYRASGFFLNQIKKNTQLLRDELGGVIAVKSLDNSFSSDGRRMSSVAREKGLKPIEGFQLKYVYLFDKSVKIKTIPFDKIPKEVRMYKGVKRTELESKASVLQTEESGALPTSALHLTRETN